MKNLTLKVKKIIDELYYSEKNYSIYDIADILVERYNLNYIRAENILNRYLKKYQGD